jgi:WD40 repeat protein
MYSWQYPISPDGKYTVTIKSDEQQTSAKLQISNLSGKAIATIPKILTEGGNRIYSVDFRPKSDLFVTSDDATGVIRLWNLQGKQVKKFQANLSLFDKVYFTADGDRIIIFNNSSFELWNLAGNRIKTIDKLEFESELGTKFIERLDFTNSIFDRKSERFLTLSRLKDKTTIVLGDINGKAIATWQAGQGEAWFDENSMSPINSNYDVVQFSSDGKRIAALGMDKIVRVWNAQGEQITQYKGLAMAFSPDGKKIVVVDPQDGIPRMWSVEDLKGLLARGCDLIRVNFITGGADESDLQMCGIDSNKALH